MKKGFLLAEIILAIFLISFISLFLLRGYNTYTKIAKKEVLFLKMLLLTDEALCDFLLKEKEFKALRELPQDYVFADKRFTFRYEAEQQLLRSLWECQAQTHYEEKQTKTIDTIIFLKWSKEEEGGEGPGD